MRLDDDEDDRWRDGDTREKIKTLSVTCRVTCVTEEPSLADFDCETG